MRYDAHTALVVVDMQNDFADPAGSLSVSGAAGVLPVVNGEVEAAGEAAAVVVYTQDWHPPETPHFATSGGTWPVHCVRDTWGAELHPDLVVEGPIVRKGTGGEDGYSGFTALDVTTGERKPTELDDILRDKGIDEVVVVGLAQDVCVKATALDALRLGYETSVVLSATRPVNLSPADEAAANEEMAAAGVTLQP